MARIATGIQRAVDFLANYYRGELALEKSEEEKRLKRELLEARQRSDTRAEMELQAKLAEAAGKREQLAGARRELEDMGIHLTEGENPYPLLQKMRENQMQKMGLVSKAEQPISKTQVFTMGKYLYDLEYKKLAAELKEMQHQYFPQLFGKDFAGREKVPSRQAYGKAKDAYYFQAGGHEIIGRIKELEDKLERLNTDPSGSIAEYGQMYLKTIGKPPHEVLDDEGPDESKNTLTGRKESPPPELMDSLSQELEEF